MLVDQLAEEVVHWGVRAFPGHRRYVANGAQDRKVEVFARVDLDDVHVPDLAVLVAREELRLLLDRGDGRAQPDSHEISPGLLAKALQADRQERTTLRGADLVDLVEDDPFDVCEVFTEFRSAQDDCDALGCRDENVWRVAGPPLAVLWRGVFRPKAHPARGVGVY